MLGYTPQDVRKMSVWQYAAAIEGYSEAHANEDDKSLTAKEHDELADWLGI